MTTPAADAISTAAAAAAPFAKRLHKNYTTHIKRELEHVSAIKPIHLLTPPDIPISRQRAFPIHSWVPAHNPFAFPDPPVLPRSEQILKNLLDNTTTPLYKKVEVFITMAEAYNDSVYRAPTATTTPTTPATPTPIPSFINYALSVLTRSLNEEVEDADSPRPPPRLTEKETARLQQFGHLWFYALLQGSTDCTLVGYQNADPWHLWLGFMQHIPITTLWRAMMLQYISYEFKFNFIYGNFICKDMYTHLSYLGTDTPPKEADAATTAFVHATTNFKEVYEELKCAPHAANSLFIPNTKGT